VKRILWGVLFLASLGCVGSWAQKDGVVSTNAGKRVYYTKPRQQTVSAGEDLATKLTTIYSNLGKGDNVYNAIAGYGILGPDAGQPWPQSVACAFKPKADHTVTAVQVGTTYVQGPNTFVVSLNVDDNNKPGRALHAWKFQNLPTFGTCCTLQTGRVPAGVRVRKNQQYWVMVRPTTAGTDSYGVWNDNFQELQGTFSNNIGSGWDTSFQVLGAFGVFGK